MDAKEPIIKYPLRLTDSADTFAITDLGPVLHIGGHVSPFKITPIIFIHFILLQSRRLRVLKVHGLAFPPVADRLLRGVDVVHVAFPNCVVRLGHLGVESVRLILDVLRVLRWNVRLVILRILEVLVGICIFF